MKTNRHRNTAHILQKNPAAAACVCVCVRVHSAATAGGGRGGEKTPALQRFKTEKDFKNGKLEKSKTQKFTKNSHATLLLSSLQLQPLQSSSRKKDAEIYSDPAIFNKSPSRPEVETWNLRGGFNLEPVDPLLLGVPLTAPCNDSGSVSQSTNLWNCNRCSV